MSRSCWKIKGVCRSVYKKLMGFGEDERVIKVLRGSRIPRDFLGKKVLVNNGKEFMELLILEEMVGRKFGEFSFTKRRGRKIHTEEDKLKVKKESKKGKKVKE